MEFIKEFRQLPVSAKTLLSTTQEGDQNPPQHWENLIISAFNLGQKATAQDVLYSLEQIQSSIRLNDGLFLDLINELQERLKNKSSD